jgi:hypothetical protein
MSAEDDFTDAVVKALGKRYSSTVISECRGGGGANKGCGGIGTLLFLKWSGVVVRE